MQKTYRPDHISKKGVLNHGEVPMYYVENSHEAIIDKETFEHVKQEIERRAERYKSKPGSKEKHLFTGIIHCGICSKPYRRKITALGTKYAKPVWVCWTSFSQGKDFCPAKRISETILINKTSEVLKRNISDQESLCRYIADVKVFTDHLLYTFQDGHTEETFWQNPSRRESWTDEMKQTARECALRSAKRRRKNSGDD